MGLARIIRYGTARYPEAVARRLRVVNTASWCCALFGAGFALAQALDPSPQAWKPALANLVGAALLAAVPLLHRFGDLAGPLAFIAIANAYVLAVLALLGTATGMQIQFLAVAAGSVVFFDPRRAAFPIAISVIAAVLVVLAEIVVPRDTGVLSAHQLLANFVACIAGTMAILFAVIFHAVSAAARSEAAIERERQRSEALLRNILPAPVAERLKGGGERLIADRYEEASVLFADMAGFTARASEMDPADLVRFLDRAFSEFDRLVDRHGLEKIKTTGDAYMVVSGVPVPRADHAPALADLALELQAIARSLGGRDGAALEIRVGLASGPVVAGVVGSKRFFYDVWGDAVNVAARMESTALPGRIQVSPAAFERLQGAFTLEPRGEVEIKGKGRMPTWLLIGRALPPAQGREPAS
jgi:adenylate cyclase